jgi:hypothetical protein
MTPQALLWLWDQGSAPHAGSQSGTRRALTLLAAAFPELDPDELEAWPLGERDRHLLALREGLCGRDLPGRDPCPGCGELAEFSLSTADLLALPAASTAEQSLEIGDLRLRFRLPNSRDLLAAEEAESPDAAEQLLLRRCLLGAQRQGEAAELTDPEIEALAQRMAELDPLAEVLLDLSCAHCGHRWRRGLEIAEIVFAEVRLLARRLLEEIAWLARCYGWTEGEILALSPARRRAYLELIHP